MLEANNAELDKLNEMIEEYFTDEKFVAEFEAVVCVRVVYSRQPSSGGSTRKKGLRTRSLLGCARLPDETRTRLKLMLSASASWLGPRTPAGQAAYISESPLGSDYSPRLDSPRKHPDLSSCRESRSGLASSGGGNKRPASHQRRLPSPKTSHSTPFTASPDLSPALSMESLRESPILTVMESASPPAGGSMSPCRVEARSSKALATSGPGTPESRASSRKRGGSGRVSWQQRHLRAEATAKRHAGPPSLYRWLVSRLLSRHGRERVVQERGPDAEATTLDHTCRTSEICSTRPFWKGTSSVSGPDAPAAARSSLRSDLCTAVLAAVVVVLVTSVMWVLFMGGGDQTSAAVTAPHCITDTCIKYERVLSLTMDPNSPPCDDFYHYVCGTWLRTGNRPIYELNWGRFLNEVGRRVTALDASVNDDYSAGSRQSNGKDRAAGEDKALTSIRACLSPLKRDNVEEVKEVLAAAGLPWPDRSARPDVIESMFFMSQRVYHALFVDIVESGKSDADDQPSLTFASDVQFKRVYEKIGEHVMSVRIRSHFRTCYESFADASAVHDEQRQERLYRKFMEMKTFLDSNMVGVAAKSSRSNYSTFLSMTLPVPESRWDVALRRYFNASLRSFNFTYIENESQFSALFRAWNVYGEDSMTDFFGWFAVQALLPYTNRRLLASYFRSESMGGDEMRESCVFTAYMVFPVALDSFLLRDVLEAIQYAKDLVHTISGSLHRLLRGNRSSLIGDALPQPNATRVADAFEIVNAYSEAIVFHLYKDFPDVHPEQPLRNAIKLKRYLYNRKQPTATYRAVDANMFDGFHLNPQLLSFPWYASDARPAVLMGGLGSRLAGTLYLDFVERRPNAEAVYRENWGCLGLQNVDDDSHVDLVAATAAVNVVWDVFWNGDLPRRVQTTSRDGNASRTTSEHEVPANYSDPALLFVFYCWLTCGDQWGPSMCNVPLKHSPHFAGVFGCPPEVPMNPTKKCRMIV
ncbi:hypothetical protein HPB51_013387 [Rhipicephalus microplus]|uniref:Peptidase M13 N-terminal domain-containing protein n=1 Tax=Rhipicephalus microplus TaxID=6941 RepID=A0A9J6F2W7_RHIMP|nr:hypothetical protein HPB51_013387 [Rhipicephalus microplus]